MMAKFREIQLSSGAKIFLGKNAQNNDELVANAQPKDILLHTEKPGSPFCNAGTKPNKESLKQAAIICASYSQDWRDNKSDVIIHKFKKSDTYKTKTMKTGTWGVKRKTKIKVKKQDIENYETN